LEDHSAAATAKRILFRTRWNVGKHFVIHSTWRTVAIRSNPVIHTSLKSTRAMECWPMGVWIFLSLGSWFPQKVRLTNENCERYMSAHGLQILAQTDVGGLLSFRFMFKVPDPSIRATNLVFHVNLTDEDEVKSFLVDAAYTLEERETGLYMIVEVKDFGFDESLTYDERTNFSGFFLSAITGENNEFSLFIPVFCAGDGETVHFELMSP
jgi:hypothetical protein